MPFFKKHSSDMDDFGAFRYKTRSNHGFIIVIAALAAIAVSVYLISQRVGELIIKLSEWKITDSIDILVNDAIYDKIEELNTKYSDIVTFERDNNGKITALATNMAYVNVLKTQIINEIYEKIPDAEEDTVYVPIANIIGSKIFSGTGAYIPVKILSVTNIDSELKNEFSDAGINQSYHRIFFDIDVELAVLIPGYKGSVTVSKRVLIAETVIVGDVPNTYLNLNQ